MSKKIENKIKIALKPVHIQTFLFLVGYFIFSNAVFVSLVTNRDMYVSYLGPFIFGIASSFIFLYFFSHRDFFSFIGKFEEDQKEKEDDYLSRFMKYGKYLACILVSQVGGPIFLALTVRFLFLPSQNRYLIVLISTIASTLFGVALAKGLLSFF